MDATKIRLSQPELELITNADIILTKNAVMKKIQGLLEEIQEEEALVLSHADFIPPEVRASGSKISRGENYQGLPYLVLDQPRHFEMGNIFAIRTMFWWGRLFSITLHLSGRYMPLLDSKQKFAQLKEEGYFLCVNEDQWKHHFEEDNYLPLSAVEDAPTNDKHFIKVAKKFTLEHFETLPGILIEEYKKLIGILKDQLPSR